MCFVVVVVYFVQYIHLCFCVVCKKKKTVLKFEQLPHIIYYVQTSQLHFKDIKVPEDYSSQT